MYRSGDQNTVILSGRIHGEVRRYDDSGKVVFTLRQGRQRFYVEAPIDPTSPLPSSMSLTHGSRVLVRGSLFVRRQGNGVRAESVVALGRS
jgi:hypothetical protein